MAADAGEALDVEHALGGNLPMAVLPAVHMAGVTSWMQPPGRPLLLARQF